MRNPDYSRRVGVTGLGVISSVGNDKASAWRSLVEGRSGLGPITRFDASVYEHQVAGEVRDFDASAWMEHKAVRRSEREMHFGVAAAKQALADSGFEITDANRTDVGVVFGSGAGGQNLMIDNFATLKERGPARVSPTFIANALVDSTSGMIAIETGAIGHNVCIVSACATGTHNVAEAAEAIRRGDCTAIISGSTESPLLEVAHAGFENMRGLGLPRPGEPLETVSRPFDLTRNGFVLGEGAGSLFLEDLELAKARGAHIYAEVVGYGSAADGWDMIQPIEGGTGSARALKMALERRGVPADEVDDRPHDGRRRRVRGLRDRHVDRRADDPRHAELPRSRPGLRPVGRRRDRSGAAPVRPLEQHRPRRAQRRGHLQALRRRLTRPGSPRRAATIRPMPSQDPARRAVVTAMGAISPIGNDAETYWSNLLAGVSGAGPITTFDASAFDVQIAAEVKDFDPSLTMDRKMARRMSRFVHFGVAAATEAMERSGIDYAAMTLEERDRAAVIVNTGGGGMEEVTGAADTLRERGPGQVSPFAIPALSGSMGAAQVSMKFGFTGPLITQVAACASGVIAFQDALRLIDSGECDVVVAGGTEGPLLPIAFAALGNMGALSKRNDDPEGASRPFDRTRDGFVFGEGAGILVVESMAHALQRGAPILAELIGAALTADAYHISAPEPTGRGASRAMTNAMRQAGVAPDEIDHIVAHGTSTPLNDATETKAIKVAFGERARRIPISSPKSMIGHTLGAAGALSAIAAVGTIRDGWIAPTINYHEPDPECDLDYVPNVKRQARVDTVMINGFGFGGQNAVAIFRRFLA